MENWKAALYVRLSKEDGDKEESDSITNQKDLLRSYVKSMSGIVIVSEWVDDGFSGADFQRPAFQNMIEDIKAGLVNCVIVKDLSRFGRNFAETGKYLEHIFPFLGVRFISVNDGIDSVKKKSHSDSLMIPFLNLINDAYCRDISVKIRSQLDTKRKKGDFIGSFAVYGYKKQDDNKNKLVIDEYAADIVRQIFKWKLEGMSQQGIANRLNGLGVLSPMEYKNYTGLSYSTNFKTSSKAKWSAVAVGRILRDETYIGTLVQGKSGTPNHKIKKKIMKPQEDWTRVTDTHDPIINEKDFLTVSQILSRDTRIAPGEDKVYPFSGIVKCGNCHENMIRKTAHAGDKRYIYFICCKGCKKHRISEDILTDSVTVATRSHIGNITNMKRILLFIDNLPLQKEEVQRLDRQVAQKNAEIERYEKLIFSLYENRQNGILNEIEYLEMKSKYNAMCQEAQNAAMNLTEEIENIINRKEEKNAWIEYFKQHHNFEELTRKMLISVVEEITVYPESRLEIFFKYHYDYQWAARFAEADGKMYVPTEMPHCFQEVM